MDIFFRAALVGEAPVHFFCLAQNDAATPVPFAVPDSSMFFNDLK